MMRKCEYKQVDFGKSDVGVACRGSYLFTVIENLTIEAAFILKFTLLCLTLFIENHILDCPEQMITSPKMTPARLTCQHSQLVERQVPAWAESVRAVRLPKLGT